MPERDMQTDQVTLVNERKESIYLEWECRKGAVVGSFISVYEQQQATEF